MDKYEQRRQALRQLKERLGRGGIARIAAEIGKEPNYVSRMLYPPEKEGRKRIGEDSVEVLDRKFPGWLSGDATEPSLLPIVHEGHTRIPVLEVSPSAGHGGEPVDFPAIRDYLEVTNGWAKRHFGTSLSGVRVVCVSGDSMAPTMNDGDLAFVDTSVTAFEREGVYVLMFDGRLLIKRIRVNLSNRLVEICSDNERAYPVQTVHPNELDRLHIVGAVRAWWSLQNG